MRLALTTIGRVDEEACRLRLVVQVSLVVALSAL
jgi:hypothetical protein